jgi:uncharacterized protein DUF4240
MDPRQFWQLIEQSKAQSEGDCDRQADALTALLLELPATAIVAFDGLFDEYAGQAYRNDLWAAAYIINGGCSDDGFEYFRRWLIGQGEAVYTAALRDPESLLSVVTPHIGGAPFLVGALRYRCEPLGGVADQVYAQKTGSVMPRQPRPNCELIGEDWDEDDLPAMLPRLWAAFE